MNVTDHDRGDNQNQECDFDLKSVLEFDKQVDDQERKQQEDGVNSWVHLKSRREFPL